MYIYEFSAESTAAFMYLYSLTYYPYLCAIFQRVILAVLRAIFTPTFIVIRLLYLSVL